MNRFYHVIFYLLVFSLGQVSAETPTNIPIEPDLGFSNIGSALHSISESSPDTIGCTITTGNCSITIDGLSSADYTKVFNSNWQIVWDCNPWANGGCNPIETITGLDNGTYYVQACGSTLPYTVAGCGQVIPSLSIGDVTAGENAGTASLTITASMPSASPITVTYTANPGTAGAGIDYTPVTATAIIPAGQTATTISIPLVNDNIAEPTETFTVALSNPNGATLADNSATVTVIDNDVNQTPSLTIGDVTVNEDAGTASLTVTASTPSTSPITVSYTTNPGTAGVGTDYTPVNGTAVIPAGQTSTTISIPVVDDNTEEPTETLTVDLSNPTGATLADDSGTVTILDNDANGGPCMVSTDGCSITISGLDGSEYVKVFNSLWQIQWDCNPWVNGGCNPTEVVTGLPNGNYFVQACGSNQPVTITGCGQMTPSLTIGDVTVNEDDGTATLTITASMPSTSPITVTYTTNPGTAGIGTDYTPVTGTAVIPAGQTSTTIFIPVVDDNTAEPTETLTVDLSNPTGATLADDSSTVTILDNDANQTPSLTIGDVTVNEDDGTATLTITASEPSTSPITVSYTTNPGTAGIGTDYTPVTGTAVIPAGQTSTTIFIPVVDDNTAEPTETLTVDLSNPTGATLADDSGTVTILDNDANQTPSLTIGDVTVNEDDGIASLTVTASTPSTSPITVSYTTNPGTAGVGTDYTPVNGTAVIPAGQTSTTISIPVVDDNTEEPTETLTVDLSNPTGATLADDSGTVTILDNDANGGPCMVSTDGCSITISGLDGSEYVKVFNSLWQIQWDCNPWVNGGCNPTEVVTGLPNGNYFVQACGSNQPVTITGCGQMTPSLTIGDVTVNEDDGTATLTITASEPSTSPITVTYTTNPGTAGVGTDYTPVTGTAVIPAGQTSTTIFIPVVDDNTAEPTETLTVDLSNPTGATLADDSGTVTILDDDANQAPSLTIGDVTVNEDDGIATLTITASEPSTSPITVTYTTNPGTAGVGTDYTPVTGTAVIPAGQTSTTIFIPVVDDNTEEPTETLTVDLSNPTGATLADDSGTVTILDDDANQAPSLTIGDVTVNEDDGTANLTITASEPSTSPIFVIYTTNLGTAMAGTDYVPVMATATIPAGQTSTTIAISLVDDNTPEPTEIFTVDLSNASGATLADDSAIVSVLDTDVIPLPTLTIGDITVDEDMGTASLTITASEPSTEPIFVSYTTAPGTALEGDDFLPVDLIVVIPAGQTMTTVFIPLVNDMEQEPTEEFTVNLSNPIGATIADDSAIVTVTDMDAAPLPLVSIGNVTADEDTGEAILTITISEPSADPVTVVYTTFDGTAMEPGDYTAVTAIATIPAGETMVMVTIPLVNDNDPEMDENFTVVLTNPTAAVLGDATGIVTITDMDVFDPCLALGGDTDGDGVCDDEDCQPNNPAFPAMPGSACDDGNPLTINDVLDADGCICAGIPDPCIDAFVIECEAYIDENDEWEVLADCSVTVTVEDELRLSANPNNYASYVWSGPNGFSAIGNNGGDVLVADAVSLDDAGVYTVEVTDLNGCVLTKTITVIVVENPCLAEGGVDTDGDGICDDEDCKPYNPNFPTAPGTPCNDGISNTINDVIASDGCGCAGQLVGPVCNYTNYHYKDWEDYAYGFWQDGGHSCDRSTTRGVDGGYSVRLKDNDGAASSTYTDLMNLSNVSKVEFNFMVLFQGMEHGEDLLLEYSTNGGSTYQTAHQWISGVHLFNGGDLDFTNVVVEIATNFSSQTRFRFRCDATSALDQVYLDDIYVNTCTEYNDPFAGQRPTYRTIDGKLNNFDNPEFGVVGSTLFNEIPPQYGDGVGSLGGQNRKSPREISNLLSDEPQDRRDERLLSGITYQFGQFLDHDMVIASGGFEFAPISVPSYDPVFAGGGIIPFTRSLGIPGVSPRQQPNGLSPYIDASNVYGIDPVRAAWLRTYQDGKLKTSDGNQLPYNTIDGEWDSDLDLTAPRMERDEEQDGTRRKLAVTGDIRANEHPNLAAFHLIFLREHNRLCDMFKSQGETDDEIIYQKARKLIGAMMQRIVYKEFLPALGVSLDSYSGYDSNVRPDIRNTFATAAYRWHTMVENDIIMRNDNCEGIGTVELPLKSIFQNPEILRQYGPGVLLRGLAFHPQYRTDLKVNNGLRNFLFGQGQGLDLVAINLQRGRDHGLPDYKTVRQYYGGSNISSFSDINSDYEISSRLAKAYSNVNDIDLWAGIFAEPLVPGTSLPATAYAIVKKQFEVLRDGDFYYYKNDPFLTNSDRDIIEGSSLSEILKRNTSVESVPSNIFFKEPCDEVEALEDTKDELQPVCNTHGATFMTSCSNTSGTDRNEGTYFNTSNVRQIKIQLGFSVRITNNQGASSYYTDDTGCLPTAFSGSNISSIEVICLSKDPSTIDCTGFAGALFSSCGSSPLPIFTTGDYNMEQLKSLGVANDDVEALRVNNGFQVTLYEYDNFEGASWTYTGPTVLCLPSHESNKMSSMNVICLSDPDRSNCGFNGVAGAVFLHSSGDSENPGPNDHIGASIGVGDYTMSRLQQMNVGNDEIKAVKVNNGYAITLFEHDNFEGNYTVYMGDESDLSTTIEETLYPIWDVLGLFPYTNTITMEAQTSSIKVRCIESLQTFAFVSPNALTFNASKESGKVKLFITHSFGKDADYMVIEKFNGGTGEFEFMEELSVNASAASHSSYDRNPAFGDNIYRVIVYYADGTEEETPYQTVRFDKPEHFNVYPNPASDVVNIDLQQYLGKDVDVKIFDMFGTQIADQQFVGLAESIVSFDLSIAVSGNYLVRVVSEGGKAVTKKFTVINKR